MIKQDFIQSPFIHCRPASGGGPHCCQESVYPKVRLTNERAGCHIYKILLYKPAVRCTGRAVRFPTRPSPLRQSPRHSRRRNALTLSGIYPLKSSEGCWKREKGRVDVDESNKEQVKKEAIETKKQG